MSAIERAIEKKEYIERGAIINFKSSKQEHPLDDKTKYFAVFIEKDGEIAHVSLIMGWILCNWIKRDYYGEILFVLADKFKNAVTEGISAADVEPVVHAHWIHEKYHGNLAIFSRCSKCGFQYNASIYDAKTFKSIIEKEYNYCPHCGAHMDERSEEE